MIEDLCYGTGLFLYSSATARAVNLNFTDDEFINSFVVYKRVLSYNEGHEASL